MKRVLALFVLLVFTRSIPPVWAESPRPDPPQKQIKVRRPLTPAEYQWAKITHSMRRYVTELNDASELSRRELQRDCFSLVRNDQIKRFASIALGVKSKFQSIADSPAHKAKIRKQYLSTAIAADEIPSLITNHLRAAQEKMSAIDSQFLVRINADVDLDTTVIPSVTIHEEAIESRIDAIAQSISEDVVKATAQSAAGVAIGIGGGIAAQKLAQDALQRDGSLSFMDNVVAGVIGIAGDIATNKIADEVMQTEPEFIRSVSRLTQKLVDQSVRSGEMGALVSGTFDDLANQHKNKIAQAIIAELKIDPQWAVAYYNTHANQENK
ncbi:MAG: hypothetical protein AAGG48_29325 [Planctomycetota bacterium]